MSDGFLRATEHGSARRVYLDMLRRMTPEQRLLKGFELSRRAKIAFLEGLKAYRPELSESERLALYRDQEDRCRNQNY